MLDIHQPARASTARTRTRKIAPGRPASVDSLYRIASLTKPITASAVLISEQAGRLSRTDKIGRFLAYAEPAPTLDELIKHIPGLSNFTDTPAYQSGNSLSHHSGKPLVAHPALGRHSAKPVQQLASTYFWARHFSR